MAQPRSQTTPAALAVVRIALLTGVLLFGAVTWLMRRDRPAAMPPGMTPQVLDLIMQGAWIASLVGIVTVFVLHRRARTADRLASLSIAGWALGELPAIAGGVRYFLTGDSRWYVWGVGALLLTYVIFPVPRTR